MRSPSPLVAVTIALLAAGCPTPAAPADAGPSDAPPLDGGPDASVVRTRAPVGRLRTEGLEIVDAEGTPVALRGANLGAWLFVETWMNLFDYPLHGRVVVEGERAGIRDAVVTAVRATGRPASGEGLDAYLDRVEAALPAGTSGTAWATARAATLACPRVDDDSDAPLRAALEARFGVAGRDRLLDAYADAWITEDDIAALADRGANLVRVPTGYRAYLEGSDSDPTTLPLRLRETTLARLERLLDWCEAHGVRAIIDLQESIGGHNDYSGPARLYEDPAAQEATIALWRAIADRLRDRDSVAAYSLLAEPFGAPSVTAMVDMYDRLHDALRADGDDHILVIHDGFMGVGVLPVAADVGWTNVVYSTHLFEWGSDSLEDYQALTVLWRASFGTARERQGVPFFVGSFSTLSDEPWAWDAFDHVTTFFASEGYSWSVWAWKRLDDPLDEELFGDGATGWGVLREGAAGSAPSRLDVCHDDLDALVTAAATLRTSTLAPNPAFDAAFRAATAR